MSQRQKPSIDCGRLYFPNLPREYVPELLQRHGDFLLRRAGEGGRVLSVNSRGQLYHFRFTDATKTVYNMEGKTFTSLEAMINHYYQNGLKWAGKDDVFLLTPVLNTVELIEYGRLKFVQELGRGHFGEVWRGNLTPLMTMSWMSILGSGEEVAIKILAQNISEVERAEFVEEARLMSRLRHENVTVMKGLTFWKPDPTTPTKVMIILEYCNLGSMEKLLQKNLVGRKGMEQTLVDAAKGLAYLHGCSIVHRDIAARNCLVNRIEDKFIVKIADFGLSRTVSTSYKMLAKRRLPVFATPPEALKTRTWTTESDVWSYGVLMQEVYSGGKNPYETHYGSLPLKQMVTEMLNGVRLPMPPIMPVGLAQLSLRCMSNPSERPTMKAVVEELMRLVDYVRKEALHV